MPHKSGYGLGNRRKRQLPTKAKAGEMLEHGEVRGKPLTPGQKGLFGMIRGGGTPTRMRRR